MGAHEVHSTTVYCIYVIDRCCQWWRSHALSLPVYISRLMSFNCPEGLLCACAWTVLVLSDTWRIMWCLSIEQ